MASALKGAFARVGRGGGQRRRVLVCGMAEGADLIAAQVRPRSWGLEAILPLPRVAWRAHLAAQDGVRGADLARFDRLLAKASVIVLPPRQGGPDYEALARLLALRCRRIVAVWDGEPGEAGGTGSVVALARARGVPVDVIAARRWMRG